MKKFVWSSLSGRIFCLVILGVFVLGGVLALCLTTAHSPTATPDALSSSTAYYKNGSSFYTRTSATYYHCTNSSHSGTNKYSSSSSFSGTCYTRTVTCTTCNGTGSRTTSTYHSCSKTQSCSTCSGNGYTTSTCPTCNGSGYIYDTCNVCNGTGRAGSCSRCNGSGKCPTCGGSGDTVGGALGNTHYGCTACGGSGENGWLGDPYVQGSGTCSLCNGDGKARCGGCSGDKVKKRSCVKTINNSCTNCGGDGEIKCTTCSGKGYYYTYSTVSCSKTQTNSYSHSVSSYQEYTYTNIDTGSTTTSTSSYSTATGFTISYNANGGSGSMSSQYFLHGHSQNLTANAFTRSNYRFKGWATSTSGAVTYTDKQSVSLSSGSNITLYANWELLSFTVTLNNQGATTAGTASVTATNGQPMPSITKPTKTGYTFGGYYTGTNGSGTQYYTASGASARTCDLTGATTLYAKWTANTYTVTLDNQGATTAGSASVTATYGSAMPSITKPTKTGYTFGGYYTATSGSGTQYYSASGASIKNYDKASSLTLYAKWTANKYTVTLNNQGATTAGSANVTATYGSALPTITPASRGNYILGGYFTEPQGKGTMYYDATGSPVVSTWENTAGITLYAYWLAYKIVLTTDSTTTEYAEYSVVSDDYKLLNLMITPTSGSKIVAFSFDNSKWYTNNKSTNEIYNSNVATGATAYMSTSTDAWLLELKNITYNGTISIYLRIQ